MYLHCIYTSSSLLIKGLLGHGLQLYVLALYIYFKFTINKGTAKVMDCIYMYLHCIYASSSLLIKGLLGHGLQLYVLALYIYFKFTINKGTARSWTATICTCTVYILQVHY